MASYFATAQAGLAAQNILSVNDLLKLPKYVWNMLIFKVKAIDLNSNAKISYKLLSIDNGPIDKFLYDENENVLKAIRPLEINRRYYLQLEAINNFGKYKILMKTSKFDIKFKQIHFEGQQGPTFKLMFREKVRKRFLTSTKMLLYNNRRLRNKVYNKIIF